MYSAHQLDNVAQRGTGVFYQALPAIGADGRNIMALIPVQMVNGKYAKIQIKPRTKETLPVNALSAAPVPLGIKTAVPSLQTFLRIPVNQVQAVSPSEVPKDIKNQLLIPTTNSFSSSHLTSVPSVSSKTTVCQNNVSSYDSELENFCSTPVTSLSLGLPKSHLKLIPKVSQRPNSPMKWVIEEVSSNDNSVDRPHCPSVPPKPFPNLESNNKFEALEKVMPAPLSSLTTSETRQQDTVMCNGRVFFAAKKDACSSPVVSKENRCQLENSAVTSSSSSLSQHSSIITPNEPNEVIDLCSDDNSDDLCPTLQTDPLLDEDNVIFVSYIPPKSENAPIPNPVEKTLPNEITQTSTRNLDHEDVAKRTTLNHADTAQHQLNECESCNRSSIGQRQQHNRGLGNSSNELPVCRSDHFLRQVFGVTDDVRICLQRINAVSSRLSLNKFAQNGPAEDIQQTSNRLNDSELSMQYNYKPGDPDRSSCPVSIKRTKVSDEQNSSGEIVSSSPHAGNYTGECCVLNQKRKAKKRNCRISHKTIFYDLDTGLMVGYVEPIDDETLNSDENDTPNSPNSTARVPKSTPSNTSRMGRARKRTMCPCCVPGSLNTSTRVEQSERLTWTRDHTSKKSGRLKKLK